MRVLNSKVDRSEVIDHYLGVEAKKGKSIPSDRSTLDWADPNQSDSWLEIHGYKPGAMTAFKSWALVTIQLDNIRECAIYAGFAKKLVAPRQPFQGYQRLGILLDEGYLRPWQPGDAHRGWYEPIRAGQPITREWAIILRPGVRSERSTLYVEDGSGRAAWYAKQVRDQTDVVHAYIGFDPDTTSNWLASHLDNGYFVNNDGYYVSLERAIAISRSLWTGDSSPIW